MTQQQQDHCLRKVSSSSIFSLYIEYLTEMLMFIEFIKRVEKTMRGLLSFFATTLMNLIMLGYFFS